MYTLKNDGDRYEMAFGHFIADTFPNYEVFWREMIIPLTERSGSIRLRRGLDEKLQRLAEGHYSVFWHLSAAHRLREKSAGSWEDAELLFDSVLFHLSAATEMVDGVLFTLASIAQSMARIEISEAQPKTTAEASKIVQNFVRGKSYVTNHLKDFLTTGRTVSVLLHSKEAYFRELLQASRAKSAYQAFYDSFADLRQYRNRVAHNPIVARRWDGKQFWVPTVKHLAACRNWAKANESTHLGNFRPATELEDKFTQTLERGMNALWEDIIPYCMEMRNDTRYPPMPPVSSFFPEETDLVAYPGPIDLSELRFSDPVSASGFGQWDDSSSHNTAGSADHFGEPWKSPQPPDVPGD